MAALGRTGMVLATRAIQWTDAQPAPDQSALLAAVQAVRGVRVWTRLEFLERFTPEEVQAVLRRGSLSSATSPSAVPVAAVWARWAAVDEIRSDSPTLAAAMQVLVDAGLITAERRDAILTGD